MTPPMMGEGQTPVVASAAVGPLFGATHLYFKLESCNPSGSYKDRFIAAQMVHMLRDGARGCLATSSGNTGSALAAYCARYGVGCLIAVNDTAPAGKLVQMQAHGARVVRIPDFVSSSEVTQDVLDTLRQFSAASGFPLVVSAYRYCPRGMQGVESIAHELLRQVPELRHIFVPVGGGGLFSAMCRGIDSARAGVLVHAVQPAGCATVVDSWKRGATTARPVSSTTRISGLSVPNDIDATLALGLLQKHGGRGYAVTDEEVYAAQMLLLHREGIYCEPAGAAALAGYALALEARDVPPGDVAVCLVTGHGFKDPASIETAAKRNSASLTSASQLRAELESFHHSVCNPEDRGMPFIQS